MAFFDKGWDPSGIEYRFHLDWLPQQKISALDDLNAGALHLLDGSFNIPGLKIHPAARVFNKMRPYAKPDRVERGEFYTVICRKAANEDFPGAIFPKPFLQARTATMAIVEETAVTIHACIRAFLNDLHDSIPLQTTGEVRTMRTLNTMHRPQSLRQTIEIDLIK